MALSTIIFHHQELSHQLKLTEMEKQKLKIAQFGMKHQLRTNSEIIELMEMSEESKIKFRTSTTTIKSVQTEHDSTDDEALKYFKGTLLLSKRDDIEHIRPRKTQNTI
ncbi:unnamed protein product [Wuchereria bancrofti]|uniref:Uncharacterized protein n=1 Tax=Wuchereria bancrofti TaxID=6293 RepID=A0A3P7FJH1_WUCBA|nr:unnamed protein product [Wuchereria bancrofti]